MSPQCLYCRCMSALLSRFHASLILLRMLERVSDPFSNTLYLHRLNSALSSGDRCCAATFILAFGLCFFSFDSTCLSKNSQFLLSALVSVKSHFLLRGARPFFLLSKNSSF